MNSFLKSSEAKMKPINWVKNLLDKTLGSQENISHLPPSPPQTFQKPFEYDFPHFFGDYSF